MDIHLVDGTYELFRYHFALPGHTRADGLEVGAVRGVLSSMLSMIEEGATHVGVATDHVIPSFRNELYEGYKDGSEIDPEIEGQFQLLEDVLEAAGFTVWPMVEYEADDALGSAAVQAAADPRVKRAIICTPDKDLSQCVTPDGRIVQFDRRKRIWYDRDGVIDKFGVPPESIPDYLGLVGDTADGFPGLKGWGAKSSATVLARWGHIENIPRNQADWDVNVRGAAKLAQTLRDNLAEALLFRRIATIEPEAIELDDVESLRWTGPSANVADVLATADALGQLDRINSLSASR
ncbi:MAG: 5'-3' exonuclease H3TH domain-containing protein [Acidimicrobiales bacterium]